MLIVDSQVAPRLEAGLRTEQKVDQLKRWVESQTANAVYLKDEDLSPANIERQFGQKMMATELEKKLKKVNQNLVFEVIPENPGHKRLSELRRGEGKVFICTYPNGLIPEHSFMRVKEEVVQDMNFYNSATNSFHLDRKDLPKHEFVPGDGFKWDSEVPLGFKKVLVPWGEYLRGWRTVLIRLVENGSATPTQVENIFGADNRPEWSAHMGKQKIQLPW